MNKSDLIDKVEKAMPYVAYLGSALCIGYGYAVSKYLGAKGGSKMLIEGLNEVSEEVGIGKKYELVNDGLFKVHIETHEIEKKES